MVIVYYDWAATIWSMYTYYLVIHRQKINDLNLIQDDFYNNVFYLFKNIVIIVYSNWH